MRDVYLAAAGRAASTAGADFPTQARAFLVDLLTQAGYPSRRVQELHWLEGGAARRAAPRDTWFPALLREAGFPAGLAAFTWPVTPLLPHYILHAALGSVESGASDASILVQTGPTGLAGLLLVSPGAVGRQNLAPRARAALMAVLPPGEVGPLAAFSSRLPRSRPPEDEPGSLQPDSREQAGPEESPPPDLPLPGEVAWLASLENPLLEDPDTLPAARWLASQAGADGDLFLCESLLRSLETERERWGLLLTAGGQAASLATLLERI